MGSEALGSRAQNGMRRMAEVMPALRSPLMKFYFGYLVPFNRRLGMRLESIALDSGTVVLRLPYRRGNRNVAGTVHGAAIMALAESVHGVTLAYGLREQHFGARIFTKSAQLTYLKKASTDLWVRFAVEPSLLAQISSELHARGKTLVSLSSLVTDQEGAAIARLEASYHVSWRPRPQSATRVGPEPADLRA